MGSAAGAAEEEWEEEGEEGEDGGEQHGAADGTGDEAGGEHAPQADGGGGRRAAHKMSQRLIGALGKIESGSQGTDVDVMGSQELRQEVKRRRAADTDLAHAWRAAEEERAVRSSKNITSKDMYALEAAPPGPSAWR